ncbi:MAG: neutral/alkaline non-lysosomal ceramidase N-terminal domain-containing protein [Opitutaceae bacterium]|nr:neutral/alkaline non-lysosomal ceramidase N-terminal domain-containing protein [Opitutaceae bacterium]
MSKAWMVFWIGAGLIFLSAATTHAAAPADESRVFRAGAVRADITPELGMMIVGGFSPTPAKQIHDELSVRTLVLDDGRQRIAFVVCDSLGLPREVCDEAKRMTQQLTGLDPAHVLISATHTHSGAFAGAETSLGFPPGEGPPTVPLAPYQRFLVKRIADSVQRAINQLEPARIGWGSGREPGQVFNRRWFVGDEAQRRNPFGGVDTVRMNPPAGSASLLKPAGPTDPEIPFIAVQDKSGRPIALLAVYSLHYVGGIPHGVVSADYYGLFAERLAQLVGVDRGPSPPFVGMMANGTSGDINNINFREKRGSLPPFGQMEKVAAIIAAEVYRAYQVVTYQDWVPLDARYEELSVGSRRPTPEMIQRARDLLEGRKPWPGWHPNEKVYAARVLFRAKAPESVALPLQAFRIGDVAIMSIPAEPFAEIGLDLKARSPFPRALTIGLANGYWGYLPSEAQHPLGGYETWVGTNRLEIAAATKITSTLLRLVKDMHHD